MIKDKEPKSMTNGLSNDTGIIISPDSSEVDHLAFRRATRKLDMFLLPAVTMIYFLNFLDRANIGNAKAAGLQTDLRLTNKQYSTALTVTYVPYIAAELPLTLAMKKIGPNIMLPVLVVAWGLVTTFQGFVTSYSGLLAARFFLGLTEGAILPSSILYMSTFYLRASFGKRLAFYFSAQSFAGAFSGLLAAAILNMDGLQGKPGWQWLFIIEGLFTVAWGGISFFLLPKDIDHTFYLSHSEKQALHQSLAVDQQTHEHHNEHLTAGSLLAALKAPQMWFVFVGLFGNGVTLYSLAYFAPTIVAAVGYKGTISIQLHSVPPYACSAVTAIAAAYWSDRLRHRGGFIVAASVVAIVGYGMFLGSRKGSVLYGSLFLQTIGNYTLAPLLSTWMANNLQGYYVRATGITMGFIATNSGGILATWLFPTTEAPRFHRATSTALGLTAAILVLAIINSVYLWHLNRRTHKSEQPEPYASERVEGHQAYKYVT